MTAVTWKAVPVHRDARGAVFEPIAEALLSRQRNIHVVINRPGAVRGNHYHRQTTERICVSGPGRVHYRRDETIVTVPIEADAVVCFYFPPGVAHAIENTGESDQVLVALSDKPHDPQSPDSVPASVV
ncbi:MAG: cupin domain-containing protein [Desulfosarcinaceae bacterium]|nr:cupin domain-containing protein [Desulfosarcinaceae bacterium]